MPQPSYRKKSDQPPLRVRNIGIQRVKVSELEDSPWNLNDHPQGQQDALDGAIDEIGFYGYPDVYQTERGTLGLIDGHLRKSRLLARYGADTEIEVNVTDFDEQGAKAANLTKDPLARMAQENAVNLDLLLRDFQTGSEPLAQMLDELAKSVGLYKDEKQSEPSGQTVGDMTYRVIVEVNDEHVQADLIERLESEGYECKPLMS